MTVYIENEYIDTLGLDIELMIKNAVKASVEYVNCPFYVDISVTLTDNEQIQVINNEQRDINKPTDVLSFPMVEYEEGFTFDSLEQSPHLFHPESGELLLGDIVLSMDKVKEQSKEFNHSIEREFTFLIVHSMLHLFGYDHIEVKDRVLMEKAQSEIMDILKIYR